MEYLANKGSRIHAGPARRRPAWNERGVTLVELMFAIVILAILTTIAVPSFRDASLGARLSTISGDLYTSVQMARSEAIKGNATTTLCPSNDETTCSGAWTDGWIIRDAGGRVIHSGAALPSGFTVSQAGGTANLSFQPIGVGATVATFTICRATPLGNQNRVISVLATGAASVARNNNTTTCP
jgi:type IV fimbrial biogenesis protein FimT